MAMRRLLGKALLVLIVLVALYLLLLWTEWLPRSIPAGRKAVAIMGEALPKIPDQQNAFAEQWLFQYDIPAADIAGVMSSDVKNFSRPSAVKVYATSASGKYPKFEDTKNLLCKPKGEKCLDKIRGQLEDYDKFFGDNEKLSQKAHALTRFTAVQSAFVPGFASPIPNYGIAAQWQISFSAYLFAKGRQGEAFELICDAANYSRNMAENSYGLFEQLVGLSFYGHDTRLLAEMLSESAGDLVLPASCENAYRPVQLKEFPLCHSMRQENRVIQFVMAEIESGNVSDSDLFTDGSWTDKLTILWFNRRATEEQFALRLVRHCSRDPEAYDPSATAKGKLWNGFTFGQLFFNPIGARLVSIDGSGAEYHVDYHARMNNLRLVQRAMRMLLSQRVLTASSKVAAPALPSSGTIRFNEKTNNVDIDLYSSETKNETLSLPLANAK